MKTYLKIFVFALLAAVLFDSCGAEIEPENGWKKYRIKSQIDSLEKWGEIHNEGLGYIAERLEEGDLTTNEAIMQMVLDFLKTQSKEYQDDQINTPTSLLTKTNTRDLSYFSRRGRELFLELELKIEGFSPNDDEETKIIALQNSIIELEKQYVEEFKTSGLSATDLEHLLKASSVARYSSAYWFYEFRKILKSQDLNASVWQRKLTLLYPTGRIEIEMFNNVPKKDIGNKTMPPTIAGSARKY